MITLEVCLADVGLARAVERAGADRFELNRRLDVGGLTPAFDTLRAIRQMVAVPIVCMIRPREGDFVYTDAEFDKMLADAGQAVDAGADGIAFGILDAFGQVDVSRCHRMIERARGAQTVFHRAFDETADPLGAMEALIDLGVHRILTSGQAPTATGGMALIRRLIERAAGRIEILPGAGVHAGNVRTIIETTGCTQVHGTFRNRGSGTLPDQPPDHSSRSISPDISPMSHETDIEHVIAVRQILNDLADQPRRTGSVTDSVERSRGSVLGPNRDPTSHKY